MLAGAMGKQMRAKLMGAIMAAGLCLATAGETAQPTAKGEDYPPSASRPARGGAGYLGESVPDERVFLPAPPADNSIAGRADMSVFRATRVQKGSPRWAMAEDDALISGQSLLGDFSCAVGATLTPAQAPLLSRLSNKVMADAIKVVGSAKDRYMRPRPFLRARGAVCVPAEELAHSGSYPSGHSTAGWLYALILTEIVPDRSSQILARGRAFGESRVVCGVHYVSDVEAGRTLASGLFAALQASPAYQTDLAAARAELTGLISAGAKPDSKSCAFQDAASRTTPW